MSRSLARVHTTAKALVEQLDHQVLPGIPDPDDERPLTVELSPDDVASIVSMANAA